MRWSLREHGIALVGPAPAELVESVTPEMLREDALVALREFDEWLEDRPLMSRRTQGVVVLSPCRILRTLDCGRVTSKRESGDWALAALDLEWRELVQTALDDRPDPWAKVRERADPALMARTHEFLDYALSSTRS